jgi:hypothetical protein
MREDEKLAYRMARLLSLVGIPSAWRRMLVGSENEAEGKEIYGWASGIERSKDYQFVRENQRDRGVAAMVACLPWHGIRCTLITSDKDNKATSSFVRNPLLSTSETIVGRQFLVIY